MIKGSYYRAAKIGQLQYEANPTDHKTTMISGSKNNAEIQRLRGIAILLVLITHLNKNSLPVLFSSGWSGVDLFFVISGYVMTSSLLRHLPAFPVQASSRERLKLSRVMLYNFFVRRFYRIAPLGVFMIAPFFLVEIWSHGVDRYPDLLREVIGLCSGFYNYTLASDLHGETFGIYWSLAVEEHFYLLLPFFFIAVKERHRIYVILVVIFATAFIVRPWALSGLEVAKWTHWRVATHLRLDAPAAGVLIALLRWQGWGNRFTKNSHFIQALMYLLIGALWLLPALTSTRSAGIDTVSSTVLTALWMTSGGLVFFASLEKGYVISIPIVAKILEYMGDRSYSLYLCHYAAAIASQKLLKIIFFTAEVPQKMSLVVLTAVAFFILTSVFASAEMLYRFVERPFIQKGLKKMIQTSPPTKAPHSETNHLAA